MSNLDSNNDHVGFGGDNNVYFSNDQVQPDRLDSAIEMRLSNISSTAPGDRVLVFSSVYVVFAKVYCALGAWECVSSV